MSRRRKNPLLGRILIISIVAHLIVLPIAARFGAFEKIKRQFQTQEIQVVPAPPVKDKAPEAPKKEEKKAEPEKKAPGPTEKSAQNLNQPKVAASTAPANGGESSGPTVNPVGSGKAGQIPTAGTPGGTGTSPVATKPPVESPRKEPERQPELKPEPKAEPVPVPKPHIPVLAAAEPINEPEIEIPSDLRDEALDKTVVVAVTVNADGSVSDPRITSSSGVSELDDLAMRAARRWKFHPATKDGDPVSGQARLHIRFKVD